MENNHKYLIMERIENIEAAYRGVIDGMRRAGYQILDVLPINEGRYVIVKAKPENVMIVFKRDFFNSFCKMFEHLGERGVGESVNRADLKYAVSVGVTRLFSVFPNGVVYTISVEDFLNNAHLWKNSQSREVYSINISHYKRVFEL